MDKLVMVARPRRILGNSRPRNPYLEGFLAGGGRLMSRPKDDVAL